MTTSPNLATFLAEGLSLRRGTRVVWDNATWSLQGPCAIVGANGSGKSSTLALLAGQVAPDTGSLRLETDLGTVDAERWMTSVSLAAPWMALPKHLTLQEALTFHGTFRTSRQGALGWQALLDMSGLRVGASVPLGQWSSGQQQRLALALALGTEATAILLDEPASNLDSEGILWYQRVLTEVSGQTTTIVATNDIEKEAPKAPSMLEI